MFACKIRFAVEKKNKQILGKNLQIFVSPSKNANHTVSIYGNGMESIFFKKINLNQFFLSPVCSTVLKKPQKWFNFFSIVFRKCMKIVDKHFLHTLDVWICMARIFVAWNCLISIFGVWRSTRAVNLNQHCINSKIYHG